MSDLPREAEQQSACAHPLCTDTIDKGEMFEVVRGARYHLECAAIARQEASTA